MPTVYHEIDAQKSQEKCKSYANKLKKTQRIFKEYAARGSLRETVAINGGIRFGAVAQEPDLSYFSWLSPEHMDDRLLASAYQFQLQRLDLHVVLITADMGVYIKAEHMGFPCIFLSVQELNPTADSL